jgi:hypothetical protein
MTPGINVIKNFFITDEEALLTNKAEAEKACRVTNPLTYLASSLTIQKKSFMTLAPGINVIKNFFITDEEALLTNKYEAEKACRVTNHLAYLASSSATGKKVL